jgi:hypothetical protein
MYCTFSIKPNHAALVEPFCSILSAIVSKLLSKALLIIHYCITLPLTISFKTFNPLLIKLFVTHRFLICQMRFHLFLCQYIGPIKVNDSKPLFVWLYKIFGISFSNFNPEEKRTCIYLFFIIGIHYDFRYWFCSKSFS